MNDKSSPPRPWRRALFLLPALLSAALIFYTLPRTQPVLAAVPELLEYQPTPEPAPTEKVDRSAQREEAEAKHADPTAGRKATVASFTAPAAYRDGVYTGSAQGFGGAVSVAVTIRDGKIADLSVTSAPGETEPYFSRARTVVARVLSAGTPNVDTVSGATFSSAGILNATKQALNKAAANPTPTPTPTPTPAPTPTPTPTPEVTPEPTPEPTPAPKLYQDGVYTARGWCEEADNFRYEILVTITVEDGLIRKVALTIGADESDYPEDNDYFIDRAVNGTTKQKGVPAQIVEAQSSDDIDGVSGATFTSNTIRRLVTEALMDAKIGGGR